MFQDKGAPSFIAAPTGRRLVSNITVRMNQKKSDGGVVGVFLVLRHDAMRTANRFIKDE
jgi:hypothetical protein